MENPKYLEPLTSEELFKNLPPIEKKQTSISLLKQMIKATTAREEFRNRDPKLADRLKKTAELKRLYKEAKKKNDPRTQELYELYKNYKEIG